jgi:hypothetical protein
MTLFRTDLLILIKDGGCVTEQAFRLSGAATMPVTLTARKRAKPGSRGGGRFFHIEVRPSAQFVAFRVQDVGAPGGVERVAGRRASGSWDTAKWLVEKSHAHVEDGRLVADSAEAKKLFASLGSAPKHVDGDRFRAEPRRDIPEDEKPTPAMRRAQLANIKKAQAALRARRKGTTR